MALGIKFDWAFNQGLASGGSEAGGYPIAIDGTGYLVDLTAGPTRSAIQVIKTRRDSVGGGYFANEATLLPTDVWRRVRDSWHQGDQQSQGDRDISLPFRFLTSQGVDPWDRWECKLLHDTTLKVSVTAANPWVGVVAGQLCVVEGTNLRWYLNAGASAVSATLSSAAVSVTQSGDRVFVALAGGTIVTYLPGGTTPTTFATLSGVTYLIWAKDFLVAATTNVLYNVTTGTPVIIRTHPLSGFRWVGGAEGMSCIYLLGGAGDKWVVHRLVIDETGTVLNPPIVSTMLPDGETGVEIGSYMGYVFVGTDKGMRFGIAQPSGDISLGPLIKTTMPVRCFEGQDRFVWFGLSNFTGTATGLGRLDLTTFTDPLAPASASDLMASGVSGEIMSATTWLGLRVFAVSAVGVYLEHATTLVPSGYLTESSITFGVPDPKNGHYVVLRTQPMNGLASVDMSFDDGSFRASAVVSDPGSVNSGNAFLNGVQFGKTSARLTLVRSASDITKGPIVTRWELRAEAVTGRGSQWQIPVIISSQLEVGGGSPVPRDVEVDRERLIGLVGSGKIVTYREGNLSWAVNITDYQWKPTHQNRSGAYEGVLTLLAREVK